MIKTIFISALALLLLAEPYAVPALTEQPSIVKLPSGSYNVTFTISEATDVEVAVIDIDDSIIVRHLAAGRLGANAPLPLLKDSLRQTIVWDGKDDYGKPLTGSGNYRVRVRAGMKAVLDTIVGDNPYRFHRTIGGLALGENGSVYAYGSAPRQMHHATCIMALRRYSADGSYERTLWPPRAGMSLSEVSAYGVVNLPDGSFLPRTEAVDVPQLGGSPLAYEDSYLIPQIRNGALYVFQHATFRYYALSANGAFVDSGRIVKSPTLPSVNVSAGVSVGGPHYLTLSPDKKYYLLSGFYRFTKKSDGVWFPTDTGFWRDGQIFKVNAATGAATPFISIPRDTMPSVESVRRLNTVGPTAPLELSLMAAFHGTAFDDSGRIFVCDRVRGEVGVYDTLGAKLGSIAVKSADQVAVNSKNGAVYVVCRNLTGLGVGWCRLYKYSDWRNGGG
ncbi:MAG: hypothetical protein JNL74_17165, partial [Fibrobacteres bacterium]|nr:hypothetical protein [Fibrobacterota bacterium]